MTIQPVPGDIPREIPRMVEAPILSPEARNLVTEVCFGKEDTLTGDCEALMIFGMSQPKNRLLCKKLFPIIILTTRPKVVYVTGGVVLGDRPESEALLDLIGPEGYPGLEFRAEAKSTDTLKNVFGAMALGLVQHSNILFLAKSPHCGRCRLTLMKHLPHALIRQKSYSPYPPDGSLQIMPHDWSDNPSHRALIWGEFLRIELYGSRGDIAYPDDIRAKVARIRELTAPMPPA